jgi:succinoglycan biosynthesis protein ExoM
MTLNNHIAICIPTYKRPKMLENLLSSIFENMIDNSLIEHIAIIIVDNDKNKSAELSVNKFSNRTNATFSLSYFFYPFKGIADVRNELIRRALNTKSAFFVFIDDDEFVTKNWLNELLKTIIYNDADAARGPVFAVMPEKVKVSKYIWCWFKRENYPDNAELSTLTTGNIILRRSSLERYKVWFDSRFNASGSEDAYFGIEFLKKGAKIFWSEKAVTYEMIPKNRANLRWLVRRIYRTSGTYSYMLKLQKEYLLVTKKAVVSVIYLILGGLALFVLLTNIKKRYWGVLKIAEGIGGISGVLNIRYKEYDN